MFLRRTGVESQAGQGVLDGAIRRGQVVVARGDQDLHVRVLGQGVAEGGGRRRVSHLGLQVPAADALAEDVIGHVALVAQLVADVVVEGGRVRGADGGQAGVEAGPAADGRAEFSMPW